MLKSKRFVLLVMTTILTVIVGIPYLYETTKLYGNDEQSIIKVIKSIEGYENQSIHLIEITDIHDDRIVVFLANNNPAYIHFSKNQNGDYEWNHIETSTGQSFATFLIDITTEKDTEIKFMFVTTKENDVARLLLDVNGNVFEKDFHVNQNSVSWMDIPNSENFNYSYKYYDENGNEIIE